jgi:purine-nucleoside phosphorylase
VCGTSWVFEPDSSGDQLVKEIRRLSQVENFDLAVVLGSGWGEAAHLGVPLASLEYSDWSCFPAGQIPGHGGSLIAVKHASWNILFFSGRFHCYQGLSAYEAALPVRLASALGCPRLLLTCATGGINPNYSPGNFMLVEDHLNLLGDNPLRGLSGHIFVDMTETYQQSVYEKLLKCELKDLVLHRGVLAAMHGPSFETPAEIHYLKSIGADVVSMSTVHEAIMARYLDMSVAGVAFITNCAAGLGPATLSHEDVLACGKQHARHFPLLVDHLLDAWRDVAIK